MILVFFIHLFSTFLCIHTSPRSTQKLKRMDYRKVNDINMLMLLMRRLENLKNGPLVKINVNYRTNDIIEFVHNKVIKTRWKNNINVTNINVVTFILVPWPGTYLFLMKSLKQGGKITLM